ncbi:MAG: MFS transporter [Candidatus Taylorbacteria bacterium]|nr:MFS transporter [Candidatus Taylorbacteria bacterium]
MDNIIRGFKNMREILLIFVSVLIVSFHFSSVYFINSSYLTGILNEKFVGYLYTAGAFINILLYLGLPYFLRKQGNFRLSMLLLILEAIALLGIAFATSPTLIVLLFILHSAVGPLLFYTLDIFLERFARPEDMGSMRGIYLTMQNIPPIITPFIAGLILTRPSNYWIIYLIAAAFLVPLAIILFSYFRSFRDQAYYILDLKEAAARFYNKKNVFDVFIDHCLLHLFYGVTVIYLPIYLADHIGFSWSSIGIIFSVMLLPFVLFQIPIGNLEDKYHDEKHVLVIGFYIMAATFMVIPFVKEASIVVWATLLFTSRIGASLVEVSSESYFFKHIHSDNAGFIGFFRMTRSLPFFISPILMTIAVTFFEFKYIFLITGLLMLLGVRYTLMITDDMKKPTQQ